MSTVRSVVATGGRQASCWSPSVLAAVAIGGTLGATGRWAVGATWERSTSGWPWATLVVNLLGCVAIGLAARRLQPGTVAWAFAVTGILGGFTTFSAFAVEVNDLLDADRFGLGALYVSITLIGGYVGTALAEGRRPPA
jgi:fluoride exporter